MGVFRAATVVPAANKKRFAGGCAHIENTTDSLQRLNEILKEMGTYLDKDEIKSDPELIDRFKKSLEALDVNGLQILETIAGILTRLSGQSPD